MAPAEASRAPAPQNANGGRTGREHRLGGRARDGRGERHRQGGGARVVEGRLFGRACGPPAGSASGGGSRGRECGGERPRADRRCHRSGVGPRALLAGEGPLRPPRRAVQQRRNQRARRAARRPDDRPVAVRRRHQPDGCLSLHAAGVCVDEGAKPARRTDHQQRVDFRLRAAARIRSLTRRRSTPSPG